MVAKLIRKKCALILSVIRLSQNKKQHTCAGACNNDILHRTSRDIKDSRKLLANKSISIRHIFKYFQPVCLRKESVVCADQRPTTQKTRLRDVWRKQASVVGDYASAMKEQNYWCVNTVTLA